ncbi:uncharacterized protein [Amphiura filiformis]|uniref:uncharacterized protein n=1 Tax=Amphiura filiformis TaxID=82378 RepID=UPI003B21C14A
MILVLLLATLFMASLSQEPQDWDIRLVNGDDEFQGRLEIFYNQKWGTVCADEWGYIESKVVCAQLGLPYQHAVFIGGAYFGEGSGPSFFKDVKCQTGIEAQIAECIYSFIGCDHSQDVSIICSEVSSVRLVGPAPNIGRIEAYYGETWIPVCQRSQYVEWNNEAARVVCNQLGYEAGGVIYMEFAEGLGLSSVVPYTVNDVGCDYSRNKLQACFYEVDTHNCQDNLQATALCFPNNAINAGLRLVNGDNYNQGRLEVYYNDQWGTVCDTYWSTGDAKVACRQLGLPYEAVEALHGAYFGTGSGPVWLDGLECDGNEDEMSACKHRGWGGHDCGHQRDAGLICSGCSKTDNLGLESGAIKDKQIKSSSEYSGYEAYKGRLGNSGYWTAEDSVPDPWIQVEFATAVTMTKVLIQGSGNSYFNAWVTEVEIQTGYSEETLTYIEEDDKPMKLTANIDIDSVVELPLPVPITARFLRINPVKCTEYCALRFDVVGCIALNECDDENGPCDVHAICSDLDDGFKCICKPGFVGNGFLCTEILSSTNHPRMEGTQDTTKISIPTKFAPDISIDTSTNNTAAIAGGLVGGIVLTILILFLLWFVFRNQRMSKATALELPDPQNNQLSPLDTQAETPIGNIYQGIQDQPNEYAEADFSQDQHNPTNGYAHLSDNTYACPDQNQAIPEDNPNTIEYPYADIDHGHANSSNFDEYARVNKTKIQVESIQSNPDSTNHTLPKQDQCNPLQNNPCESEYYTYVDTPPGSSNQSSGQPLTTSQEGWMDNTIYSSSTDDETPTAQTTSSHVTMAAEPVAIVTQNNEGWIDNTLYATSGGSEDVQQDPSTHVQHEEEGWVDNSIYDV